MKSLNTNKVVFSVYSTKRDIVDNTFAHEDVKASLIANNIAFLEAEGCYKGVTERSFILESSDILKHDDNVRLSRAIARDYDQEAVLEVLNDGTTFLEYLDGREGVELGVLRECPKETALLGDYTYVPATGLYYTVTKA